MGVAMAKVKQPSKEAVRAYLQERLQSRSPPPSIEEINRHLGRHLIEQQRTGKYRR
jgi:hypothetical protein